MRLETIRPRDIGLLLAIYNDERRIAAASPFLADGDDPHEYAARMAAKDNLRFWGVRLRPWLGKGPTARKQRLRCLHRLERLRLAIPQRDGGRSFVALTDRGRSLAIELRRKADPAAVAAVVLARIIAAEAKTERSDPFPS